MAKMHLCSCVVAIAGDIRNTVVKQGNDAVSFPEIQVLKAMHGPESVTDIKVIAEVDSDQASEKARLALIYPPETVDSLYPGYAPMLPMTLPGGTVPKAAKPKAAAKPAVEEEQGEKQTDEQGSEETAEQF